MCLQTLQANGEKQITTFVFVFFPGAFLLVSLIISKFAMATGERLEARLARASQRIEEFGQIVEVLKSREPEGEVRLDFATTSTRLHLTCVLSCLCHLD